MLPRINDMLYIQNLTRPDEDPVEESKARISEINKESIVVEIPIHVKTGKLRRPHLGDRLSISYMSPDGVKRIFDTEVTGYKQEVIRLVMLRTPQPKEIRKIQRRTYLRVAAELELSVGLPGDEQQRFLTLTEDIGGGGISFISRRVSFEPGDRIHSWLLMQNRNGDPDPVSFSASVVRIKKLEDHHSLLVMVRFEEISEAERERIIRYCFEKQLEMRK